MDVWQAVILAIVEGITEFLPISSTGHLVLAARLLAIPQTEFVKSFEIVIQLGAILAVAVMYARKILANTKLIRPVLTAFVPTAILGLVFYKFIKVYLLGNTAVTVAALLVGGVFILVYERKLHNQKDVISGLDTKKSLTIGLVQVISMIPGVSRAMATIFGGMGAGLTRAEATEFSFLLAVPTMAAATGLDLVKSGWSFTGNEWITLGIGFTGAFITAWLTVKWLVSYVQNHDFKIFGVYRIVLAVFFLIFTTRFN